MCRKAAASEGRAARRRSPRLGGRVAGIRMADSQSAGLAVRLRPDSQAHMGVGNWAAHTPGAAIRLQVGVPAISAKHTEVPEPDAQ